MSAPSPAKLPQLPLRMQRLKGAAKATGPEFEQKLAALVALRARRTGLRFQLFSNVKALCPCDDLLIKMNTDPPVLCLVQLKHSEKSFALDITKLKDKNGHLCILKYFDIFWNMWRKKEKWERGEVVAEKDKELAELLEGVSLDDIRVLLYTNRAVQRRGHAPASVRTTPRFEDLFLTGDSNDAFWFDANDKEVWNLNVTSGRQSFYRREFLPRFKIFTSQCHADKLDDLILQEIRSMFGGGVPNEKTYLGDYLRFVKLWAQDDAQDFCLTEESAPLHLEQRLAGELREGARESAAQLLFQSEACERLREALRGHVM